MDGWMGQMDDNRCVNTFCIPGTIAMDSLSEKSEHSHFRWYVYPRALFEFVSIY